MIKSQIIKNKISKYFSSRDDIKFAYLFGSQSKNKTGRLSDIDIAVYLDEHFDGNERFDIRLKLIGQIGSLLKTDKIDLIILNDSPLLLSFNIVHDGIIIYSSDESKRIQFEVRIMSLYFDQQYYYKRHAQMTIDRIAKEGIL
ncbi:MAG: nucleotidyltransferase domain-containing protein [Candidatus Omnitrophota bacterium]|nr:MAG: nucleotidyltransferase domain-containing protein [Candidatus Omnitrophota bacterium]